MYELHELEFLNTPPETERGTERYLVEQAREHGMLIRKLVYQGQAGAPDRMLVAPDGQVLFVECKAPAGRLTRQQSVELSALRGKNVLVAVVRRKSEVDDLFRLRSLHDKGAFNQHFPLENKP